MADSRNQVILEEAERWHREGKITAQQYEWLRQDYKVEGDAHTARTLQTVLMTVAGVLTLIGIFTLVSEFWSDMSHPQKFWTLAGFTTLAILLGGLAHLYPRTRGLAHFLLPLSVPLYLFAMVYVQQPLDYVGFLVPPNPLTVPEMAALAVGVALTVASLVVGLRRSPTLALAGPPGLIAVLAFLDNYMLLSEDSRRLLQFLCLLAVLALHALLLALWTGRLRLKAHWEPLSARLALAANVAWGFATIVALVGSYAYHYDDANPEASYRVFDETYVGVPLTALYVAVLLAFALRLGLPELTGVCGLFLIGDALWLGVDKGGIWGAVAAIFATAIALLVLAQRGVLLRILRPKPPPVPSRS